MESSGVSAPKSAAIAFILGTVVLDVLAFGLIAPVLPVLIRQFHGGDTAAAAATYGVFGTAWAVMQFLWSPLMGVLSDRFGRRPVLLISLTGLGLDYILMGLAPSLTWLFVGRVISGITAATYSTASAYVTDVTPKEKRAAAYGYIGAAWGVGFVVAPAIGGLLGEWHPRLPFWVAAVLTLANALYGWFVVPESLPLSSRNAFSWRRANPFGSLRLIRARRGLAGLFTVQTLHIIAHYSLPSVFVLYATHRYGWSLSQIGWTLGFMGVCTAIVQGLLIGPAVRRFGERNSLLIGLVAETIGYAGYALAPNGVCFLAAIPFGALGGLYSASAQTLMAHRVQPEEQGELQGASSSLMGLAGIVGPGLFSGALAWALSTTDGKLPGLPFLVAAALTAGAYGVGVFATRYRRPAGT
jgi:DHA1 family tetracycline resistance protein-like MFS transporter